jgi:hypothetical protein
MGNENAIEVTELPKLMISYSRADLDFVVQLVRDLKTLGIHAWFDRIDIRAGANWDAEIERALAEADVLLVVVSQHSVRSEHVKNEISYAMENGKQVVPLTIDSHSVPLMITRVQREDFRGDYHTALPKLVARIKGGGRTEALAAVSEEEVLALKRASLRRLAEQDGSKERPSLAGARGWDRRSMDPAVASIPALTTPKRGGTGWFVGSGLVVALAIGSGLYWQSQSGAPLAAEEQRLDAPANVQVGAGVVSGVSAAQLEPLVLTVDPEASVGALAATAAVTASNLNAPLDSPAPAAASAELAAPSATALTADPKAAEREAVKPALEQPKSTYRAVPARLRGTWFQKCTVTGEDSLRSDLIFGNSTIQIIVNRYPTPRSVPCTGGFVRNTEEYEVARIEEYENGRYTVDLKVKNLSLMPSSIAYTLNNEKFAGKSDWVNTQQVNMLGARSLDYFGFEGVASNTVLYGTWQLRNRKLQYMWGKDMSLDPEKRPVIPESNWVFEAKQ